MSFSIDTEHSYNYDIHNTDLYDTGGSMHKKSYTIGLSMIVKDKSHTISSTLESIYNIFHFDYWVICDTGSTDQTKSIIHAFFKNRNIPGLLLDVIWNGSGNAKTISLMNIYNKTDYVFVYDADFKVCGDLKKPISLNKDMYLFQINKRFTYFKPLLLNNRLKWEVKGLLNDADILFTVDTLENGIEYFQNKHFYIQYNKKSTQEKYLNNATVLENEILYNKPVALNDPKLYDKYLFNCAKNYNNANLIEKSLYYYKKVLENNNCNQERFNACISIGDIYNKQYLLQNALIYWEGSLQFDNKRLEGIERIISYYYFEKKHIDVLYYFKKYKHIKQIQDISRYLFLDKQSYLNIRYFVCVSSYYCNELNLGFNCCKELILSNYEFDKKNVYYNLAYYFDSGYPSLLKDCKKTSIEFIKKITEQLREFKEQNNKEMYEKIWLYVKDHLDNVDYITLAINNK